MMREKVKEKVSSWFGKTLFFKYKGARNQNEEFRGYVNHIYSNVFTICLVEKENLLKTFSYSDVLIGNLVILEK